MKLMSRAASIARAWLVRPSAVGGLMRDGVSLDQAANGVEPFAAEDSGRWRHG